MARTRFANLASLILASTVYLAGCSTNIPSRIGNYTIDKEARIVIAQDLERMKTRYEQASNHVRPQSGGH